MKKNLEKSLAQLADAHNNLVKSFNLKINQLESNLGKLSQDFGSIFDVIYANERVRKTSAPTMNGFVDFCKTKMNMDFFDMTNDVKMTSLVQYFESISNTPMEVYNEFIFESFRKRNKLVTLKNEKPVNGDIAIMSWVFTSADGMSFKNDYGAYNLGQNMLLVDAEILEMKPKEKKEFSVSFPKEYPNPQLASKSGNMTIIIHSFERNLQNYKQPESQEDKKEIWDKKYKSNIIE